LSTMKVSIAAGALAVPVAAEHDGFGLADTLSKMLKTVENVVDIDSASTGIADSLRDMIPKNKDDMV